MLRVMQRITVSLGDDLAERVRVGAAQRRASVSLFAAGLIEWALGGEGEARSTATAGSAGASEVTEAALASGSADVPSPPRASRPTSSEGGCPMVVPRGVKCKLCGKVHAA